MCPLTSWSLATGRSDVHIVKLSNDPDKNCSIFYCSAAICFSHIEIVVFSYGECINRWKAGL